MLSFWQLLQLLLATLPAVAINLTGYEYIVVGSGAGGGPLAARLALAGHSTLLLEAGTDQAHNLNTSVPAYAALAAADDHLSWNFFIRHYADDAQQARDPKTVYTTPTGEQYVGLNPPSGSIMKGILYTRASTLGGCTAHNALVAIYPHRSDWTYIANLTNDPSWLPDPMRKYYIRLENNHYLSPDIPGHGYTGWLSTEHAPINLVLQDPQLLSLLLGAVFTQPRTILSNLISLLLGDVNSPSPSRDSKPAYYQTPIATSSNVRNGAADFLRAVLSATNPDGTQKYPLTIRTNCHVTRVLFDTTSPPPKATGVSFLDGPYLYRASPLSSPNTPRTPGTATATREVILSVGVFNTPQILQLSGIGPADLLQKHNIPVLVNLPGVGANLQDHYETSVVVEAPFPFRILNGCTFNYTSDPCLIRWLNPKGLHKDRGIYSSAGFTSTLLHHTPFPNTSTTPNTNEDNNNDDYNTIIYGGLVNFRGYFPGFEVNITRTHHSFTWAIIQAHPSNRAGTVNISSSDPLDPPHILFNSFSDPDSEKDLFALVDVIRVARRALKRQLIPTWETLPGKEVRGYEELRQYVLDTSWGHHAVGSCRIGRGEGDDDDDDEGAVVDGKFRVRGVRGLRVVDASVFPRAQGTFPVLGVYMLAEKAVGDILGDDGG